MPDNEPICDVPFDAAHPPRGALAWRKYDITLPSGLMGAFIFTLGDPDQRDTFPARMANKHKGKVFGTLAIEVPGEPERPIVWMITGRSLQIWFPPNDPDPAEEVRLALIDYFATFFNEVKDFAPSLVDAAPSAHLN